MLDIKNTTEENMIQHNRERQEEINVRKTNIPTAIETINDEENVIEEGSISPASGLSGRSSFISESSDSDIERYNSSELSDDNESVSFFKKVEEEKQEDNETVAKEEESINESTETVAKEEESINESTETVEEVNKVDTEEEVAIKHLLAQGMRLLDLHRELQEEGDPSEDMLDKAIDLFNMAGNDARQVNNSYLEGRAMYSLAVSYSESEERKLAAGPMFHLAADLFISTNNKNDAVTSVINAAELLIQEDLKEDALACLQRYDKRVESGGLFADMMVHLILQDEHATAEA